MKISQVRQRAFAMPLTSPAYPPGPYRFVDREFLIITYRTDPEKLRALVPAPVLEVVSTTHILADLTLGLGKVAYDYLASPEVGPAPEARVLDRSGLELVP